MTLGEKLEFFLLQFAFVLRALLFLSLDAVATAYDPQLDIALANARRQPLEL